MAKSTSTMKSFMDVLAQYKNDTTTSGIAILDHAVRAVSGFSSLQDAIDAFVDDVTDTDTSKYKDVNDRLEKTCGIVLGAENDFEADTGAVSGENAGNGEDSRKNAVTIVPEKTNDKLSSFSMPGPGSCTKHSYTVAPADDDDGDVDGKGHKRFYSPNDG